MAVAEFYGEYLHALSELGIDVRINEIPNEIAEAIPFDRDTTHEAYDRDYANRFWRALLRSHDAFSALPNVFSRQSEPGAVLLGAASTSQ